MKPPLFIRPLTDDEYRQLEADRCTMDACRVRRAQIVLASARGPSPQPIAQLVGCSVQTVRNVIHAFNTQGVEGLEKQSNRPKTAKPVLDTAHCERLQHLLHQSPRLYGKPTGVWALGLAAAVCDEQGITERVLRDESIRRAGELLSYVGLGARARHRPSEMSGGEQQRVAIARALANRPGLLLADEPTGELDARTGAEIIALFQRLNQDGTTLVVVTHDEDLASAARRKIHMRDGKVDA